MVSFELTIPLGSKGAMGREAVIVVIMDYLEKSQRGKNDLPPGVVSGEVTRVGYRDGTAHSESVVFYSGHGGGGVSALYMPHLRDLIEALRQNGFACRESDIWVDSGIATIA